MAQEAVVIPLIVIVFFETLSANNTVMIFCESYGPRWRRRRASGCLTAAVVMLVWKMAVVVVFEAIETLM
jgi:hypothetical protein